MKDNVTYSYSWRHMKMKFTKQATIIVTLQDRGLGMMWGGVKMVGKSHKYDISG